MGIPNDLCDNRPNMETGNEVYPSDASSSEHIWGLCWPQGWVDKTRWSPNPTLRDLHKSPVQGGASKPRWGGGGEGWKTKNTARSRISGDECERLDASRLVPR